MSAFAAHRSRLLLPGLAAALVLGLLVFAPAPAQAAPAAGKSCAKVGATATVGWTQFACRKTSTGKVWKVAARGPVYTATEEGTLITCVADPSAVQLGTDARVYYAAGGGSCSTPGAEPPDSLVVPLAGGTPTVDVGRRFEIGGPAGPHKRILRLPDGRYRMYFSTGFNSTAVGIGSAISTDGLTFTEEPGLRIAVADAGVAPRPALSPGDIVTTKDGRYRMYFSSFAFRPRDPEGEVEVIRSAVSTDLLTWTVEAGDRIGGSARIGGSGEHPAVVRQPDGSVTIFYGRPTNQYGLYYAWSPDGLTFTKEVLLFPRVLDSAFIRQPNGQLVGFVGRRDDVAGIGRIDRVLLTPRR
jgi:hypothetical protein